MNDDIEALIAEARVPKDQRDKARDLLGQYLRPHRTSGKSVVRSLHDASTQRGTRTYHNEHLDSIAYAVAKLEDVLLKLRRRPYAHSDFWQSERFGPVDYDEIERAHILHVLQAMRGAALDAKIKKGKPAKTGKLRIAITAARIFADIRGTGATAANRRAFCQRFYSTAIREKKLPRADRVLSDRQIKAAVTAVSRVRGRNPA